ncbi:MAG: ANTAR domain-containing protein [Clostridiales bacterium]|jgi:response regulator NasT|nr:ANTAR domain-containing protein [Clostridiales bacterium]
MALDSALLVSNSEKGVAFFTDMLKNVSCQNITAVSACGQAKRLAGESDFDYCIINAPLSDGTGEALARDIAMNGYCQVILVVKAEVFEEVSSHVEDLGVITVAKPINKTLFWNALKLAVAARKKVRKLQTENSALMRRIEDIRVIHRAKCILISYHSMSEPEAHKYIEKQAMDTRKPKRAVAEGILKTYEI